MRTANLLLRLCFCYFLIIAPVMLLARQPSLPIPVLGPAPVALTYFIGVNIPKQHNVLRWQTAQELNAAYFFIEKSLDGLVFSPIGKVMAQGDTKESTDYEFMDSEWIGNAYYRLRQVDFDETFTFSPVVFVKGGGAIGVNNPFEDLLTIDFTNTGVHTWRVLSSLGQVIKEGEYHDLDFVVKVHTADWPSGTYILEVHSSGNAWSKRLLKK